MVQLETIILELTDANNKIITFKTERYPEESLKDLLEGRELLAHLNNIWLPGPEDSMTKFTPVKIRIIERKSSDAD